MTDTPPHSPQPQGGEVPDPRSVEQPGAGHPQIPQPGVSAAGRAGGAYPDGPSAAGDPMRYPNPEGMGEVRYEPREQTAPSDSDPSHTTQSEHAQYQQQYGATPYQTDQPPPAGYAGSDPAQPQYGTAYPENQPPQQDYQASYQQQTATGYTEADQPVYGYQQARPQLDVGQALSYGWDTFRSNTGAWLGVTAIGFLIYLAFVAVVQVMKPASMLPVLLIQLVVLVAIWLLQAVMVRGALFESDGNQPPFGSFFRNLNVGNVLLTALLAFVLTCFAGLFCIVPGLVVGVLCMFSLHFVLDRDMGPFQAIRASVLLVLGNPAPVALLALAVILMTLATAFTCGLGLLAVGPLSVLAVTFAYRSLSGGRVTAY